MIDTASKKVQINQIVQSQLPSFVVDQNPLFVDFLEQTYLSQESQGGPIDLITNFNEYQKVETFSGNDNLIGFTTCVGEVLSYDDVINVTSTAGWPKSYGLLKIDDEIITYAGITTNSFTGCIRGFSGVESLHKSNQPERLVFSNSDAADHISSTRVLNLSNLFLQEFWKKLRTQFLPGFEDRSLENKVDKANFLRSAKDFYASKGTDESFKILFGALFAKTAEVIKPSNYLIAPSDADYIITDDMIGELISGDPQKIVGQTLYQTSNSAASASIFNVIRQPKNNREYYLISLNKGSITGDFKVTKNTTLVEGVAIGGTVLTVDSTVGFGETGTIYVGAGQTVGIVTYTNKSSTQFFNVTGISSAYSDGEFVRDQNTIYAYEDGDTTKPVYFRLTSVASGVNLSDVGFSVPNDSFKAKSLGNVSKPTDYRLNSWIHNLKTKTEVSKDVATNTSNIDVPNNRITTSTPHLLFVGDSVTILDQDSNTPSNVEGTVSVINDPNTFTINITAGSLNVNRTYKVRKNLSFASHNDSLYQVNNYVANVQNTYVGVDGKNVYVASGSLPSYEIYATNRRKTFTSANITSNSIIINNHGFHSGDFVKYNPVGSTIITGLSTGSIYAVTRIDENTFKLSTSASDAANKSFVSITGAGTTHELVPNELYNKSIQHQNFLREFPINPVLIDVDTELLNENIGMFRNGVEIFSNRSGDIINYGKISNIDVENGGSGYDVINPPNIHIKDSVGSGATAYAIVENGSFKSIDILTTGYDIQQVPNISITGGNGTGATASARLRRERYGKSFDPDLDVNLVLDQIEFDTDHQFYNGESIVYKKSTSYAAIGGLADQSIYYVNKVSDSTIKLMKTYDEALAGINTINLTSRSTGENTFTSTTARNVLDRVVVDNPGSGYSNRKVLVESIIHPPADFLQVENALTGINTSFDYIFSKSHGFRSGDLLEYRTSDTVISGLTTTQNYYVVKVDDDRFKLTSAGIGTTSTTQNYLKQEIIDLKSVGVGTHTFRYPEISVSIDVVSGFANTSVSTPTLRPVCTGEITQVVITESGTGYGSTDTFNFHRRPEVTISNGSGAIIDVIISDGRLTGAYVVNGGKGYQTPPTLQVDGDGKYAKLAATLSNGSISSVTIVDAGTGYTQSKTSVSVKTVGNGAKLRGDVYKWSVDFVQRHKETISANDDGVIVPSQNPTYGAKFVHAYAARKLRSYLDDNINSDFTEAVTLSHSPILGWAYDGSPIYGPYGYSSPTGGAVRLLEPGYTLVTKNNRPPTSVYPLGFFIDDYEYTADGDLDEHNGRFCKTPEFPDGIYAYFCTIESSNSSTSPFVGNREPRFPYVLNRFKFKKNVFNDLPTSTQNLPLLDTGELARNTYPYKFGFGKSEYDYLVTNNLTDIQATVRSVSKTGITTINVISPGEDYKIGDRVLFNNSNTGGSGAAAKVKTIVGKGITEISYNTTTVSNVAFSYEGTKITGIASTAHNLRDGDIIVVSGVGTGNLKFIEGVRTIAVSSVTARLDDGIGTSGVTGITTDLIFENSGQSSDIFVNDILVAGSTAERLTVLSVDKNNNKYRVLRQSGVVTSHSAGTLFVVDQSRFTFETGIKTDLSVVQNRKIVFNPQNSIGIGTTSVVVSVAGIGTTTVVRQFAANGTILSDHQLGPADNTITIVNHGLQTGDKLVYSPGTTGIALTVSNNVNLSGSFVLTDGQTVFAVRKGIDLLGITTTRTGVGSTGISLYFTQIQSERGTQHSFTTTNKEYLGTVNRYEVSVDTVSDHTLKTNDRVSVHLEPKTTLSKTVEYDSVSRKTIVTPQYFSTSAVGVGTSLSTITISNHNYSPGEKILYTSSNPLTPLVSKGEYFVKVIDSDTFKLCTNYTDAVNESGSYIGITSFGSGVHTVASINPIITAYRGQTVGFAVSDASNTDLKLEFYEDEDYNNRYEGFGISTEVTRSGTPGSSGAIVNLKLSENVPTPLYYKLVPTNLDSITVDKRNVSPDYEVVGGSKLVIQNSVYTGTFGITTTTNKRFKYLVGQKPENSTYTTSGITTYRYVSIASSTAIGGINELDITFGGVNYIKNPGINTVTTSRGNSSLLRLYDSSVGRPTNVEVNKIGFDLPTDKTLIPKVDFPSIVTVKKNFKLTEVGIITAGRNYVIAPEVIIPDRPDVTLKAEIQGTSIQKISILSDANGFDDIPPRIFTIRNTNGVGISTASSNGDTNFLTINQPTNGYKADGSDFPFTVGDRIFVEGIGLSTSLSSTGGYNSSDYNYTFFTVASVTPTTAQLTYSIVGLGTTGGTFSADRSAGRVIAERDLPTFGTKFAPSNFTPGEKVGYNNNDFAFVLENQGYDPVTNTLRLTSATSDIEVGDVIKGTVSKAEGTVVNVQTFDKYFDLNYFSERPKGWQRDTGKLNDSFQKIRDNDYYQNFSYSIQSEVQEKEWTDAVDSIIHPAGYKNFSDLIVPSESAVGFARSNNLRVGFGASDVSLIVSADTVVKFATDYDFDIVSEEVIPETGISKFVLFKNKKLTSFTNIVTNKVNVIDDISDQFTGIGTTTSAEYVGLTTFKLTSDNGSTVLFNKVFNGSSSSVVSAGSSLLTILNHQFQTGERVKYDPGGSYGNNRIGIQTTSSVLGGVSTSFLPSEVYVIRIDNNTLQLAGLSTAVTNADPLIFRSVGSGTSHSLDTLNPNNRTIIDIDGIIQSPLYKKNVSITLSEAVGVGSTTIKVVGVTSITGSDIINIDDELLRVKTVGFGSTNVITVDRAILGSVAAAHTVGAACTLRSGDYFIRKDVIFFLDPPFGKTPGISSLSPGITTNSTFGGRTFTRKNPTTNFIFDDLSDKFTGVGKTFTLLQDGANVTGIVTTISGDGGQDEVVNNGIVLINNIFQRPEVDYTMEQRTNPGIGASIFFTGTTRNDLPVGGVVDNVRVGVGSGYQPLVAAAATAIINGAGAIQSVVVTGGGSGYRSGPISIQVLNPLGVGSTAVLTATVGTAGTITGITTVSGGSGYASTDAPTIIVGVPTGYSNMSFTGGQGTGFKASVIVGMGGSIIDFNITDRGTGYANGNVLTVAGIPTDSTVGSAFSTFNLTVDSVISNKFAGFSFGQLLPLYDFSSEFDGGKRKFQLRQIITQQTINIDSNEAGVEPQNNLLVFLNDVIQRPGENYSFSGGTEIEFAEAPVAGSKLQILFYRGSNNDVSSQSPFLTLKAGDTVQLERNLDYPQQDQRRVITVISVDRVETNLYAGVGVNTNVNFTRMASIERQTSDLIFDGQPLSKARENLKSKIQPTARIIRNVGVSSDEIFVDQAFPFFSAYDNRSSKNTVPSPGIELVRENNISKADATVSVSAGGTITSVVITNGGDGYIDPPTITFGSTIAQTQLIGKSWTQSTSNTNIEFQDVDYTDFGMFVAVGSTSGINTSSDGTTWNNSGVSGFGTFFGVVGLTTNVIAVGLGGTIAISTDRGGTYSGSTIYTKSLLGFVNVFTDTVITQDLNDVVDGLNKVVAVGAAGTILYSDNGPVGYGTAFIISGKYSSQNLRGVGHNGGTFIAVGDNGEILRSNSGEIWSGVTTSSVVTRLNDVRWGDNTWVAVGAAGTIITSSDDGVTWSVVSSGSTFNLNSLYYQDNVWVAVGQTGNVLVSKNASSWYKRSVGISTDFNGLTFGDNKLLAVGLTSTIAYSEFETVSAAATATVSAGGTISAITISDGGFGYDPNTSIEVLISTEPVTKERITSVECEGDYGIVVGVGTSATGINTTGPMLKFELDADSFLNQAGFGNITKSGITAGKYFVLYNSVVGRAVTSVFPGGAAIGVGTTFLDNIYRADQVVTSSSGIVTVYSNVQSIAGIGSTSLTKIANYSWGRFYNFSRDPVNPKSFTINNQNGYSGISTAPLVVRVTPLSSTYSNFTETS